MPEPKQGPAAAAPTAAKPESLSAILREMRDPANDILTNNDLRFIADRIEAAAKRELSRAADDAASRATLDRTAKDAAEYMAYAMARKSSPQSGSAAALREALENVERVARFCAEMPQHTPCYPTDAARADALYSRIAELGRVAHAALAAPARNCDRFHDEDEAVRAYLDEVCSLADNGAPTNEIACNLKMIRWLFAQAKGGDHA